MHPVKSTGVVRVLIVVTTAASAVTFGVAAQTPGTMQSPPAAQAVDYERDVRPILAANCFGCHGPRQAQSGLRLDLRQNALRGGDYGVVIVPGRSADSKLIKRLTGNEAGMLMPPTGALLPQDIDVLRRWIDAGAEMPGRAADAAAVMLPTAPAVQRMIDAVVDRDTARIGTLLDGDPSLARAADGFGSTVLMHAAASGSPSIMKLLLDRGADVNASNQRSATALHWGIADPDAVKLLLSSGAAVDTKTVEGRTPLYVAATMPAGAAVVRQLIAAGANVNAATLPGATPLFPAVNASAEIVRLLLDAGADPNHATRSGVTPIHFTLDSTVVKLLIDRGANVNATSKVGETALMDVSLRGDVAAARMLLDRGADVNARDHRGYTALILAAQNDGDNAELVRMLLERGADANAAAEGQTALTIAAKRGDTEVTRRLRAATSAPAPSRARAATVTPMTRGRVPAGRLRAAATRGFDLLVKTSPTFVTKGGCNSCHNQYLPSIAQGFARQRGIATGDSLVQLPPAELEASTERYAEYSAAGGAAQNVIGYELFASELAGQPADARTRSQIRYVKSQQLPEGYWRGGGFLTNHGQQALARPGAARPPLTYDHFTQTAYMIRALSAYGLGSDAADTRARIERARTWLVSAAAASTQERAFKVLGLVWSSASRAAIDAAARDLLALQRRDGGFAQLATLEPDAYATGVALFALHEAGVPATHTAYQSGLRYLLSTQAPDGTWHVKSRSLEFQPYFESGYPYGRDQWISAAGTAYATIAIAAAVPPSARSTTTAARQ